MLCHLGLATRAGPETNLANVALRPYGARTMERLAFTSLAVLLAGCGPIATDHDSVAHEESSSSTEADEPSIDDASSESESSEDASSHDASSSEEGDSEGDTSGVGTDTSTGDPGNASCDWALDCAYGCQDTLHQPLDPCTCAGACGAAVGCPEIETALGCAPPPELCCDIDADDVPDIAKALCADGGHCCDADGDTLPTGGPDGED